MRRDQIKAGVVYGIAKDFGDPAPIVFLEDAGATVWTDNNYGDEAYEPTSERPGKGRLYGDRGYAAVFPATSLAGKFDEALAAMRALDPAAELARFRAEPRRGRGDRQGPTSPLLVFGIWYNLAKLPGGTYDEMCAQKAAERTADAERREQADRERAAESARVDRLSTAFARYGITVMRESAHSGTRLSFSLDDADQLLDALRSGWQGAHE